MSMSIGNNSVEIEWKARRILHRYDEELFVRSSTLSVFNVDRWEKFLSLPSFHRFNSLSHAVNLFLLHLNLLSLSKFVQGRERVRHESLDLYHRSNSIDHFNDGFCQIRSNLSKDSHRREQWWLFYDFSLVNKIDWRRRFSASSSELIQLIFSNQCHCRDRQTCSDSVCLLIICSALCVPEVKWTVKFRMNSAGQIRSKWNGIDRSNRSFFSIESRCIDVRRE